jgi:hypothetical protein
MKKKTTGKRKTTAKCPKKPRAAKKVVAKRKTTRARGKASNTLPAMSKVRLKKTIQSIKSSLKQLEKVAGK